MREEREMEKNGIVNFKAPFQTSSTNGIKLHMSSLYGNLDSWDYNTSFL
jgi:hypothetical protein